MKKGFGDLWANLEINLRNVRKTWEALDVEIPKRKSRQTIERARRESEEKIKKFLTTKFQKLP